MCHFNRIGKADKGGPTVEVIDPFKVTLCMNNRSELAAGPRRDRDHNVDLVGQSSKLLTPNSPDISLGSIVSR